jgi:hypothetical protein
LIDTKYTRDRRLRLAGVEQRADAPSASGLDGGHDDRQETEAEIVDQDGGYRRIHGLAEPSSGRVVCVTRVLSVRAIA